MMRAATLTAAALLAGCATAAPPAQRAIGASDFVIVAREPDYRIAVIDLGEIRGAEVDVNVKGARVRGWAAGSRVALDVDGEALRGAAGGCVYDLASEDGGRHYAGTVRCAIDGDVPRFAMVQTPTATAARELTVEQQQAAVAVVLARSRAHLVPPADLVRSPGWYRPRPGMPSYPGNWQADAERIAARNPYYYGSSGGLPSQQRYGLEAADRGGYDTHQGACNAGIAPRGTCP